MMESQNPVPKKSKGHKCYLCGRKFPTIHLVRKHVNIHKDKDLECDYCGKCFSSNWGLSKHIKIHTGELPYSCNYCGRAFRQNGTLKNHIAKIHENTLPYSFCQSCGRRLKTDSNEQYCWFCVYKNETANSPGMSSGQGSTDLSSINAEDEKCPKEVNIDKSESPTKDSKCYSNAAKLPASNGVINEPNVSFNDDDYLTDTSEVPQKSVCSSCMKPFPNLIALRDHVAEVHKPNWQFACNLCKAKFVTPDALEKHVETHKEHRPFTCLICNYAFKNQIGLKSHLLTHRIDRPFKCKCCEASFKTMLSLRAHQTVHQTARPFKCRQCGFCFKSIYLLKRHMIVHSDKKPYKCNICGKLFRYPGNLGRHYNLHNKPQSFTCNICGKSFLQSAGLKQHEQNVHNKISEAEKPFICKVCKKGFKLMSNLRRHFVVHRKNTK